MGEGVWLRDEDGNYRHVSDDYYNTLQGCKFIIIAIAVAVMLIGMLLLAIFGN